MSAAWLAPQPDGIPTPTPSRWSQPYWDGCAAGQLRYQRCEDCGHVNARPSPICAGCQSADLSWASSTGRGSLYSWTVVWRPQTPAFITPYAPAIITMDEGHHVLSSIIGCDPDELVADLALVVDFHPTGSVTLPYFRRA